MTSHTKMKCPHGHTFGKDSEDFPECEECDFWNECVEENDK